MLCMCTLAENTLSKQTKKLSVHKTQEDVYMERNIKMINLNTRSRLLASTCMQRSVLMKTLYKCIVEWYSFLLIKYYNGLLFQLTCIVGLLECNLQDQFAKDLVAGSLTLSICCEKAHIYRIEPSDDHHNKTIISDILLLDLQDLWTIYEAVATTYICQKNAPPQ